MILVIAMSVGQSRSCYNCSRVTRMSNSTNDSVKTVVRVSTVFNNSDGTVWFSKRVLTLNDVSNTYFRLFFVVACVGICYSIFELIIRWSLKEKICYKLLVTWSSTYEVLSTKR